MDKAIYLSYIGNALEIELLFILPSTLMPCKISDDLLSGRKASFSFRDAYILMYHVTRDTMLHIQDLLNIYRGPE